MAHRRAPRRRQSWQNICQDAPRRPTRRGSRDCPSPAQIDAEQRPRSRRPITATKTTSVRTARRAMRANAASKRRYWDRSPSADKSDRASGASETPRRERTAGRDAADGHGESAPSPCGRGWARQTVPKERKTTTSERRLATRSTDRSRTTCGCRQSERRATDRVGCRTSKERREEIADTPAPSEMTAPARSRMLANCRAPGSTDASVGWTRSVVQLSRSSPVAR